MSEVSNTMKESKNILVLSAGRRVELINCFKNAALNLNIDSTVVAVDITDTAPALYFADKYYIVPRINDAEYLPAIIDICNKEQIALVVPTIDTGLMELAEQKHVIESSTSAKLLLSSEQVVSICRDKVETQSFFEANGFGVPKMITDEDMDKGNVTFPVFIKPKSGSSSVNAFQLKNMEELAFFRKYINDPLIQECAIGEEYTIDVFLDFESNPITIVPRRRMATRSGEILKGLIVKDQEIIDDVKRLLTVLKPIGHITIQCMKTDRGLKYIEINPRFGGGAPMSIRAGADSCKNLYRLLSGEMLSYNEDYLENVMFLRFDDSIMLNENMEIIR